MKMMIQNAFLTLALFIGAYSAQCDTATAACRLIDVANVSGLPTLVAAALNHLDDSAVQTQLGVNSTTSDVLIVVSGGARTFLDCYDVMVQKLAIPLGNSDIFLNMRTRDPGAKRTRDPTKPLTNQLDATFQDADAATLVKKILTYPRVVGYQIVGVRAPMARVRGPARTPGTLAIP
jgi:hypothetical protein